MGFQLSSAFLLQGQVEISLAGCAPGPPGKSAGSVKLLVKLRFYI